ncbi:tRNA guanosine(34) transglycosylase Tgt [Pyruvatibacter sp.]|uniref:tRNA guanosine(34) transglycosylase Tgt n=1 Tax=Pyruvatibacter sp. TaxID=1981328 RepID=UPI0032EE6B87
MSGFSFHLDATDGEARTGRVETPRGTIRTPAFMPVGTAGTVKAMLPQTVASTGADIVLGNTYHLMLRPGAEEVAALGGLHSFMNWQKPILTDSGGFQVWSLAKLRKMTEEGVTFQSHIDGSTHSLTPERSIEIQCLLGSDIQMILDECTDYPATRAQATSSMELTTRWARRSRQAFADQPQRVSGQALFGIVQGSTYPDLRLAHAQAIVDIGFDGYALGGLSVGEQQSAMLDTIEAAAPALPRTQPRYLMGVGTPEDLVEAVRRGIDMFDCVMPTRSGRHGQAFTRHGRVTLKNARHAADPRPLDDQSTCEAASVYSRAYLHHLVKSGEYLAAMLITWANVAYYQALMADIRAAIAEARFEAFVAQFYAEREAGDIEPL